MKRTAAMIYRFIFILFSVWGICQKVGFNIFSFTPEIINFTLFIDILSFFCIFIVFIINITRYPNKIIIGIKSVLTLSAMLVFLSNLPIFTNGITYDWILGILLPLMMVVDWMIFDKKGAFNFYDPLLWLIGAIILGVLLSVLLKNVFGVDNLFGGLGLFNDFNGLMSLLGKALGIGFAMYLIDCLVSAFKKKSTRNAIVLIYRLVFLALEIFAFINLIGKELTELIYNLRYYHFLSNFLCAVCIAVTVVYNLIKHHSLKKSTTPFPRLKAGFTVVLLITMIGNILFGKEIWYFSFSELIIYIIAPVMMVFDWILFDKKGSLRIFDPLLWSLIPFSYYACCMTFFTDVTRTYRRLFSLPQPEMILCSIGVVIIIGYILYLVDKVASR